MNRPPAPTRSTARRTRRAPASLVSQFGFAAGAMLLRALWGDGVVFVPLAAGGLAEAGAAGTPPASPPPSALPSATPAPVEVMHDHTPRHGGTVGMAGTRHLEVVARGDGTVVLYLTDLFRTPVPLDDLVAYARLTGAEAANGSDVAGRSGAPPGQARHPMAREGDAFVLRGADLEGRTQVDVRFELERRGERGPGGEPQQPLEALLIDFTIPVEPTTASQVASAATSDPLRRRGAAGPIANDCRLLGDASPADRGAPSPSGTPGSSSRASAASGASGLPAADGIASHPLARLCALRFRGPVDALALDPGGRELAIAAMDSWVTTWGLPPSALHSGFAPSPPLAVPAEEAAQPHGEAVGALAWRPDGAEILVASESRLLFHRARDGALLRELPRRSAIIRDVEFLPDGRSFVLATFFERAFYELASDDGREIRRIATGAEVASLAVSPDGARVAAGLEDGRLVFFDRTATPSTEPVREITIASGQAITALLWLPASAGTPSRLAVGSMDGILRLVEPGSDANPGPAAIVATSPPGRPIVALAGPLAPLPDAASPAPDDFASAARAGNSARPTGAWLASGGYDGSVRIHDPTAAVRATLPIQGGTVRALATAGDWLIVGDASGMVSVWRLGADLRR